MSWLLDTHALLWWLFDDPKLSSIARDVIADPQNEIFVSSATAWEICTKHRIGKLPAATTLVLDIAGWIGRAGFSELPITIAHAAQAGNWPQAHRDPFDRMLAAQSMIEGLTLISRDTALRSFGLSLLW